MVKTNNKSQKSIETIKHKEASRRYIPTAEYESVLSEEQQKPILTAYQRRNPDLDPQLVWRGKDMQDWSDLVVQTPPLYIQEKIHPKVLIEDLRRQTERHEKAGKSQQLDLFADFNGLPSEAAKTEFYQHEANWSNRMILGDSLQVMASLAEREGLRGKVQCIYIDPPYGIKFNSNFQWSTTSRIVTDGKVDHITREPEQVKAFRDTWRDGIHSYLTYLRDRLTLARELLTDSGSVFVQIGEENVHLVRDLMDEIFGDENYICTISFRKTSPLRSNFLARINDFVIWFSKKRDMIKFRKLYDVKSFGGDTMYAWIQFPDGTRRVMTRDEKEGLVELPSNARPYAPDNTRSSGYTASCYYPVNVYGYSFPPQKYSWKTHEEGMTRLRKAHRLDPKESLPYYVRFYDDFPVRELESYWSDTRGDMDMIYVVQTSTKVVERCILMATDPSDLVLDPTCGSGTTAYVSEQLGRRWITIDTSRVSLALARGRIMGARFPYYILRDSHEGQIKEAEQAKTYPSNDPTYGNVRQGFVYERVPHIMLSSIANNSEIDVIYDTFQENMEPLRIQLNHIVGKTWEEWEVPREMEKGWSKEAKDLHEKWWQLRIARQKEIDASIAAKAEYEYLYDKPYER